MLRIHLRVDSDLPFQPHILTLQPAYKKKIRRRKKISLLGLRHTAELSPEKEEIENYNP